MSWKTVNVAAHFSHQLQDTTKSKDTFDEPPNALASKFRTNILHAAEKLTTCGPKRKRRTSKAVTCELTTRKFKKISSKRKEPVPVRSGNYGMDVRAASSKRRSAHLQTPDAEYSPELSSLKQPAVHANASGHETSNALVKATNADSSVNITAKDSAAETESLVGQRTFSLLNVQCTSTEVETSLSDLTLTEPLVDVLFQDTSTYFDDFDDSIFDEPFQTDLVVDSLQSISSSPTISVIAAAPASKEPDTNTLKTESATGAMVTHPNGAPFPPFMHPCLLHSLDAEALELNKKDTSTPSLGHTCFRTAELLRLSKCFRSKPIAQDNELVTELFATVKEVVFANSQGQGQGLLLADIFFPSKPHMSPQPQGYPIM